MASKHSKTPGLLRLDKFLGEMGRESRSSLREMAKKGRIRVNGEVVRSCSLKIDPMTDLVTVDGEPIVYVQYEYFMLNKPAGVVSAVTDAHYTTVVSLIKEARRKDLFPVGRLDIDTEGLLLITNDGALAHRLLSPKKHVDKTYYAEICGKLPDGAAERFKEGLILTDGTKTLPARLDILKESGPGACVEVTLQEGKFHQVKRMFLSLGCEVTYLKRVRMGPLVLDGALTPGQYRRLTEEEKAFL